MNKWAPYLDEHPEIKRLVDPDFVAFDFVGGAIPATFAADVAAADVRMGAIATVRANGTPSTSLFAVASPEMANAFMGRMKALHQGVFCAVFASPVLTQW